MLSKLLSDLILQHDDQLLPYLRLISRATIQEKEVIELDKSQNLISLSDIKDLKKTGFIKLTETDSKYIIHLKQDGRWLCQPPEILKKEKTQVKSKKDYVPKHLESIAETIGYPIDWVNKKPKYRAMYFKILKKHSKEELDVLASFVSKKYPDQGLQGFLCSASLRTFQQLMRNPAKINEKTSDRTINEDYSKDQQF